MFMLSMSLALLPSAMSMSGRRGLPTLSPARSMAVLTGMGLVSMKSLSKKSARRKYSAVAGLEVAVETELTQLGNVGGDDVRGHGDDAVGAEGHHGHGVGVVAGPGRMPKIIAAHAACERVLGDVAGGLLDAVDVRVGRESLVSRGLNADAGAGRNVVEYHWNFDAVSDVAEALYEPGLGGLACSKA